MNKPGQRFVNYLLDLKRKLICKTLGINYLLSNKLWNKAETMEMTITIVYFVMKQIVLYIICPLFKAKRTFFNGRILSLIYQSIWKDMTYRIHNIWL